MARLTILEYPDPRLRTIAAPVTRFDAELKQRIADMFETMYEAPGIGLAATQVDWHHQLIVIDTTEDRSAPRVFINPEILEKEGRAAGQEGCLSVPGIYDDVERAQRVRVRYQDTKEEELTELLAVCLQHEMDHLNGKLFVDYLSDLKRQRIRRKLEKERKHSGARSRADTSAAARV
jgi:peptide deformylase